MTNKINSVRKHLLDGKSITQLQALRLYGSLRLAAIIHTLKHKQGLIIDRRMIHTIDGSIVAEYYIKKHD